MPNDSSVRPGLLVSQAQSPAAEYTRIGAWSIQTATLFAPLTAVPTTVAALEIWNNTANPSGLCMVIDDLFASQLVGPVVVESSGIFAAVAQVAAVPTLTALRVSSSSGRTFYTSSLATPVVTGVGTTVIANGWRPWGNPAAFGTGAATPGKHWSAPIDGKLIVPPGCSLLLHVVSSVATASAFQVGAGFHWASFSGTAAIGSSLTV